MVYDVAKLVDSSKVKTSIRKDLFTEIDLLLLAFWLFDANDEENDTFRVFDLIKVRRFTKNISISITKIIFICLRIWIVYAVVWAKILKYIFFFRRRMLSQLQVSFRKEKQNNFFH